MTTDPRAALNALVAALERHLELAGERRGKDDPALIAAYQRIANAFVDYDDALLEKFGEVTPLDVYSDDGEDGAADDDYDEDDLDAEDHDGVDVDSLDEPEDDEELDGQGDDGEDDGDLTPSAGRGAASHTHR
ncbi:MAG: hypothetical protein WA892_04000 [Ornithinimicrobium sp.]